MTLKWKLPEGDTYFRPILDASPLGFELDHLEFALKHVKQFRTAIDGGAHIGTWTRAMSKRFQQVVAFEPAKDSFFCLQSNLRGVPNVISFCGALGEVSGKCIVHDDPTRVGNSGSRTIEPNAEGKTALLSLDDFKLQFVDFLKLDVEGHEIFALKGAVNTIKQWGPTILVECKKFVPPRHGGPEVVVQFLTDLGYKEVGGIRNDRVFVPK